MNDFLVGRFRSDGSLSLDTTFGATGWVTTAFQTGPLDDVAERVAIQPDGKIVVVGRTDLGTFVDADNNGLVDTSETQSDWNYALARYLSDSALVAAATGPGVRADMKLDLMALKPIVNEAVARWTASGAERTLLEGVQVTIGDLNGPQLGLASGMQITLDDDAAGWGWFVDGTPDSDLEFVRRGNQGEQHRMDLLTVVMHELGHVLGYDHDDYGVMAETLAAGVRRADADHDHDHVASVDDVFQQTGGARAGSWSGWWVSEQLDSQRPWAKRRR
jgi:hypothetical protein